MVTVLHLMAFVATVLVLWWTVSLAVQLWGPESRRAQRLARIKAEKEEAKRQIRRIVHVAEMEMIRTVIDSRTRRNRQ
jgi:uncharacterized membrane protein